MKSKVDFLVIGGGAAGFFAALRHKSLFPHHAVCILEQGNQVLGKVKVSGGGRCNVTHACFEVVELVKYYPRGSKELRGPFHHFQPENMMQWLSERGVLLKTEQDGRVFPISDNAQTIIDCFLREAQQLDVEVLLQMGAKHIQPPDESHPFWQVSTTQSTVFQANLLMIATGSSPQVWKQLQRLGIEIVPAVPSLFTFHIEDARIANLAGVSVGNVNATLKDSKLSQSGALLFTHWGLSAPAVLKLSAWGARILAEKNYHFELIVNFLPHLKPTEITAHLLTYKQQFPKRHLYNYPQWGLSSRLWHNLLQYVGINEALLFADFSNKQMQLLVEVLSRSIFQVKGKSTFKEEFVTAGGVDLKEVDFKTLRAKKYPSLLFGGEVLDIDAVTGGFNFQAAWTTAWIAGAQEA